MESGLKRLGVMGGTFDPIHIGHLVAASEVAHVMRLDRVMFVPTGQPWQKERYSDPEDRYMMTVLGVTHDSRFVASRAELDRRGPTYTVDTMGVLRDFHGPGTDLLFIVGADAAMRLGTWKGIEELAELAELVAVTRPGTDLGALEPEPHWPKINIVEMPGIDVSATDIRARVRAGKPIDYLVPPSVTRYIRERGLYLESARV